MARTEMRARDAAAAPVPAARGLSRDRTATMVDLIVAVVILTVAMFVAGTSEFNRDIVLLGCVYALAGLGMYVPLVLNGELSLAYAAYVTMGAYAVGWTSANTDLTPVLGLLIGMAVAAFTASLLGLATARLNGFYLAGVTLLFDRAFRAFLADTNGLGGTGGFPSIVPGRLFGSAIDRPFVSAAAIVITVVVAIYVSRLRRGPFGLMARFQRESGRIVESIGVRSMVVKIACLAIGAAIAAIGGSLFALQNRSVFPDTFGISVVVIAIFAPLLGGQRSPWGAVLGAAVVIWLTFGLDIPPETGTLVFSIAVVVIVRLAPSGLLGIADGARRLARKRRTP